MEVALTLTLSNPCISESCIQIKINLNFIFTLLFDNMLTKKLFLTVATCF